MLKEIYEEMIYMILCSKSKRSFTIQLAMTRDYRRTDLRARRGGKGEEDRTRNRRKLKKSKVQRES